MEPNQNNIVVGGCCGITALAFGVAVTILVVVLIVRLW